MRSRLTAALCVLAFCAAVLASLAARPAAASDLQWCQITVLVNGQPQTESVYGYYVSANGGTDNAIIECGADGTPTGRVFLYGVQVGTTTEQVPQVSYGLDPDKKHTLYAAQVFPDIWYRGDIPLCRRCFDSNPLTVYCPGSTLSGPWQWMVYEFMNDDPWPVVAHVREALPNGETWDGYEPFDASQTKYLKLNLNSNAVNQNIASSLWSWANIHKNLDPLAPPPAVLGRDVINDPEADDSSGICWTADQWQGLTILSGTGGVGGRYFSQLNFWAVEPGFIETPTWVPNPGEDPHWGTIQKVATPGYTVVRSGSFEPIVNRSTLYVSAVGLPNLPHIVPGGTGVFQATPPTSGPYAIACNWQRTDYSYWSSGGYSVKGVSGSAGYGILPYWQSYVAKTWPHWVPIDNSTFGYPYSGTFYTDATRSDIIKWQLYYLTDDIEYYDYRAGQTRSGTDLGGETSVNCPADGQWHLEEGDQYCPYALEQAVMGYVPVTGSYDQITSITHSANGGISGCVVTEHTQVYNPGPGTVSFSLGQGVIDTSLYGNSAHISIPSATPASASIPPGQSRWFTSCITLPQFQPQGDYGSSVPPQWHTDRASGRGVAPDFAVGSARPAIDMLTWTASGIENSCVAYDWGDYISRDYSLYSICSSNADPGFYGSQVYDGQILGTVEAGVTAKINSVKKNGYAVWSANCVLVTNSDGGHFQYIKAS